MKKLTEKIELDYQIPCGPFQIAADGVCRKSLRDDIDRLLDRLTGEINPDSPQDTSLPEDPEDRKRKLIEQGKLRADVQMEIAKYKEELQGNSKLLQDISGKINSY
jgi:hypothetical protein